jgi:hypothetical protein
VDDTTRLGLLHRQWVGTAKAGSRRLGEEDSGRRIRLQSHSSTLRRLQISEFKTKWQSMIKVKEGFFSYWWDGGVIKCLFAISAAGVGLAILLALFHTSATIALGLIGLSVIAFLNGANDLPKSVATLTGSGTVAAPGALALGIVATLLGGLLSLFWAGQLVNLFSVGGITSVDSRTIPAFPLAVIASAVTWLLIATKRGIPISTTHTLVGASVGAAGAVAQSGGVNWDSLALVVMAPLLGGPLAAGLVGYGLS